MYYRHGDIILANPAYPDQKLSKVRPLLIISTAILHNNTDFIICVGITTNNNKDPFLSPIKNNDYESIPLREKSQVMCHRFTSLRKDKIIRKLTSIKPAFYDSVLSKIKNDVIQANYAR